MEHGPELETTEIVREPESDTRSGAQLRVGDQVRRYIVIEYIGQGANGEVFAAYDPELDRRVALKLLRRRSVRGDRALAREAQAMAKLIHPNVVAIHDVGIVILPGDRPQLFIAMEYVPGGTLRQWWTDKSRSWEEIVATFVQAGRGLAAAHARDLVHRDFKPDNVLVGQDGRVRVMDFGLARSAHELRSSDDLDAGDDADVTESGDHPDLPGASRILPASRWRGTPAYMAPEQFLGGQVDHLSDQFAFCVCFFEALNGVRPFVGATRMEIARSVTAGDRIAPLEDVEAPRRILDAVLRGLSLEREQRFPDMYALLAALDPPTRRTWPWLVLGSGLAFTALTLALTRSEPEIEVDPCEGVGDAVASLWSVPRRRALEQTILATARPEASDTAWRVLAGFDAYATALKVAQLQTCKEGGGSGKIEALRERKIECLAARQSAFAARLEVLETVAPEQVAKLVSVVDSLPRLEQCEDLEFLASATDLPDEIATDVRSFERRLERAQTLYDSSAYERTGTLLDPITSAVLTLDHAPLTARLQYLRGRLASIQHNGERALDLLHQAYFNAVTSGEDELAAKVAALIVQVLGDDLSEFEDARAWLEHGQAMAERSDSDLARAIVTSAAGFLAYRSGDLELALANMTRTLELEISVYGPHASQVGTAASNVAAILLTLHRNDESLPYHAQALSIIETELGPSHIKNVSININYGLTLMALHRDDDARQVFALAWEVLELHDDPSDAFTWALLNHGLGELEGRAEHWDESAAHFERTLEITTELLGEGNSYAINSQASYASALTRLGRLAEALPLLEQSRARAATLEMPEEDVATIDCELAIALWTQGHELERARALMASALEFFDRGSLELTPSIERWLAAHPEILAAD